MRIAYFFTDIPSYEGTFPEAEIEAMADRGIGIEIFLLRSRLAAGPGADRLRERLPVHRCGYVAPRALLAFLGSFLRHPALVASAIAGIVRDTAGHPGLLVKNLGILPKCCFFARRARGGGFDLLWAYWASLPGRAAWWVSRLSGVPYGTWAHAGNDIYNRRHQTEAALKTVLGGAALACTCNRTNLDYFRTILPAPVLERILHQPHGIDLERFEHRPRPAFAPTAANEPRALRLLAVGRLSQAKGFQHAIEACAILRDRGGRVRFRIIGDGPMRGELLARIASLGLGETVELAGELPQGRLPGEYHAADVFLMPSVVGDRGARDGLPNVLLEAMACGLPCIGSSAVGIPEAIEPGVTGLLAPPGNPAAWAEAIERIGSDPAAAARMAEAARRRVEERYARPACMERLAGIFLRFAQEHRTTRDA